MPETPDAHKEIIEIKKEVRDIRQTIDAQIYQERAKWEELLDKVLDADAGLMRVLLAIDGTKSAKDIEKECTMPQKSCWNRLNRLEREGIISKAEATKKGSPVFVKARWYRILRLDEKVQKDLASLTPTVTVQDISSEEKQEVSNEGKQSGS